jgi:hypothetical protein
MLTDEILAGFRRMDAESRRILISQEQRRRAAARKTVAVIATAAG